MKPHPHAEVLRAIADGVPLSEFERSENNVYWVCIDDLSLSRMSTYGYIRRKPQHIMVNGFKVPKPLDVMPTHGDVCHPALDQSDFYDVANVASGWVKRCFERGIAHATKEAAVAHAKAMLGIDPEYFK